MDAVTARPRPFLARLPYLHLGLFLATLVTTVTFGGLMHVPADAGDWRTVALGGLPFAAALVTILLCHEMGHYLMARAYGVDSTLPFFIPVPFGVGTFGAVIKIRSAMPSTRAVFDIGAAGPFAGFAVALPLYVWGLAHSRVHALGDLAFETSNAGSALSLVRAWLSGEPLRAGAGSIQIMGDSLVTWAAGRLVLGDLPANADVLLHPVAFAAWIGLFITTLNLIPIGQLDGGHVTYALLGWRRALAASRLVAWGLLACGLLLSWNWLLWWVVTRFFVGRRHPAALVEEPLDPRRRLLAYAALALFAITFIPVPVSF
jgi:membrane-associated protease RseP (regulator of RpoE activity)